jgi:hypothetical protein
MLVGYQGQETSGICDGGLLLWVPGCWHLLGVHTAISADESESITQVSLLELSPGALLSKKSSNDQPTQAYPYLNLGDSDAVRSLSRMIYSQ